jgi:thiol reductant ABC exporter CydD subunit
MRLLDPRLLREVPAVRRFLVLCVVLALAAAAVIVAQAALLGHVVAAAFLGHRTLAALAVPLAALAAVSIARGALAWAFESGGTLAAAGTVSTLRAQLLAHLVRARPGGIGELSAGDVAAAALDGTDALEPYFARFLPQLVLGAVVPPVLLVWVGLHDVLSAIVLLCTVPLIPVFGILIGRAAGHATMRRWRALSQLSAHFLDVVRGLPTLRAYRRSAAQTESIAAYTDEYRRSTMATLRIAFLSAFALELVASLGTAIVAVEIGIRLVDGGITLQPALAILVLAPELYAPLRAASAQFHASADGLAAARRVFELIDLAPAVPAPPAPAAAPDPAAGAVRLERLAAAYPGRGRVLDGLSLDLAPGERVAVFGASGAGKSTLLAVLLRFLEIDDGRLSVDGIDLRGVDPEAWRQRLAWVPQRPLLEPGTVAAAVRLGAPQAADRDVVAALHAAGAGALAQRLASDVTTLSAGEQRRVALARALLRGAPLLLLDEPTAHLDRRAAELVVATLATLSRACTVLVATHDPRLLAAVDRALELRGGVLHPLAATEAVA